MRYFTIKITLLMMVSLLGLGLIGCTGPIPKMAEVEGKWVAVKKEGYKLGGGQQVGFTMEFFADKTVSVPSGKGTWTILDDGRVKIEVANVIMHGSLKENMLTVTMPENKGTVIFKKM